MSDENNNTKHSIYRWIHETLPDGTIINSLRVVLADDHDRVVAELKEKYQSANREFSSTERAVLSQTIDDQANIIASQKRVIDQLTVQRNALVVFPELKYTIEELDLEIEKTK